MTRIVVRELVWNEVNRNHIKKHNVSVEEVRAATTCLSYHQRTYKGRYLLVGRSNKRILAVVIMRQAEARYFVVTARDASKVERMKLYDKEQKKQNSKF